MIIFDFSQVLISNIVVKYRDQPQDAIDENLIRHVSLDYILNYVKKFRNSYGDEIVFATDAKSYWRRDAFQYYKASRAKQRQKSKFDWTTIYNTITLLKKEFSGVLPYKVIDVDKAEGDDIIAVLTKMSSNAGRKTLIISSDMDFIQLQKYPQVEQFSPKKKGFLEVDDPDAYLREHIIRGDEDDGIPNILTRDDIYVTEGRSKSLTTKNLTEWVTHENHEDYCTSDELRRNFARNRMLIDFNYIPVEVSNSILNEYSTVEVGNKKKLMNYVFDKGLSGLLEKVGDF